MASTLTFVTAILIAVWYVAPALRRLPLAPYSRWSPSSLRAAGSAVGWVSYRLT
ncbi:MAG TPA: hypothetical protein VEK80_14115 [Kribbellaceae bacterium]|nr:hypothetical protein [Kribbellaceae bacterium]